MENQKMLDLGVISQVEKHLNETIPFSQKRKENPRFLEYAEEKRNAEFFKTYWDIVFLKIAPPPISDEIKRNINKYFEQLLPDVTTESGQFIKGYNGWVGSLLDFDFILSYFLVKTELTENSELYQIIKEYYDFLKNQCNTRSFVIPKPFDVSPLTRFQENKKSDPQNRPNCPSCNSNKIVSVGINWLCKSCGRQYRKQRKRN